MNPGDHVFGRFELVELISSRFGLWRVRDLGVNEARLLVLIPSDKEEVDRLLRTGKRFQDLSVPALPPVLEVQSDEQWVALLMGGERLSPIKMEEPLSHRDLISRCFDLTRSLDLLNAAGITHGCVDSSLILSSSSGSVFLLPPIGRSSVEDDVIGLGRLFLKLLTAGKASDDSIEPNRCSAYLAEKKPLPALFNQLITDMLAGNIPGMRHVLQRFEEIERMGKARGDVLRPARLNTQVKTPESKSKKFILPALIVLVVLLGITGLSVWSRWAEIQNANRGGKADSDIHTPKSG